MKDIWPTTWSETEDILKRVGYEALKHYYICMSEQHPREWGIMESPLDKCQHCGDLVILTTITWVYWLRLRVGMGIQICAARCLTIGGKNPAGLI